MRILLSSHVLAPSVGGLEKVTELLAREFLHQGHEVRLITQTPGVCAIDSEMDVHRRPSLWQQLNLLRWCDVFFHNNISLPRAWPLLFVTKPWVVAHHVWIPVTGLAARVKRHVLRHATGIAVSQAIADHLDTHSRVIPNPYDDMLFRPMTGIGRDRDLVFVGRLVSDKGVDLLLTALARLAAAGARPTVTVIGAGPEAEPLRSRAMALGLTHVVFAGPYSGEELARLLHRHRIMVVPSLWREPFGIVALEGMACGCVVIGSAAGGLGEAIGAAGETFPNGDAEALAQGIARLLADPERQARYRAVSVAHLQKHTRAVVAAEYLHMFAQAMEEKGMAPAGRGWSRV